MPHPVSPLRFLHIPKTAGSTFTGVLIRQYGSQRTFAFTGNTASDIKRFEALSEEDQNKVALFLGHAPIVTGIKPADEAVTITFLREPISRVKSFCQHVSEGKSSHLIRDFPPESFSLDKFLESGDVELSNLQAKILAGRGSCWTSALEGMSDAEAEYLAVDNLLHKIQLVGLQEYFDESLLLFSSTFHWRTPFYVSRNKKNTNKLLQFEQRHLEQIVALNKIDMAIYRRAKQQFMIQLGSVTSLEEKLKRFRVKNKLGLPVYVWRHIRQLSSNS